MLILIKYDFTCTHVQNTLYMYMLCVLKGRVHFSTSRSNSVTGRGWSSIKGSGINITVIIKSKLYCMNLFCAHLVQWTEYWVNHVLYVLQMRQNQLRHEDEIMRLKEQLSDAQRFVWAHNKYKTSPLQVKPSP